jgi:hypothetical protein
MRELNDTIDKDLSAHGDHFLSTLHLELDLPRLLELARVNPIAALSQIQAAQKEVLAKKRISEVLLSSMGAGMDRGLVRPVPPSKIH